MPLEIVTVGGSLAGLMTSIALCRLGHNVRILERAPTNLLHDQGAGIVAGGEIPEFFRIYDRTKTPISVASYQRLYIADKSGEQITREIRQQHMTSWDLIYNVCRANFDGYVTEYVRGRVLEDAQGEGTALYQHGHQVTRLEAGETGVRVFYRSTLPGDEKESLQLTTADFVIVAEGASSIIRKSLSRSSTERTYAGYVAFRGTVPESELSNEARAVLVEKFPFYHAEHLQILGYTIPGRNGGLEEGQRLVNWVWYHNIPEGSDEYSRVMTDCEGNTHRWTLPTGGHMREDVWAAQRELAERSLPPQFCELIKKTKHPFVQAITDLEPPSDKKCWLLGGKAVLVGDALAGFRPHTAASTAQAALHALLLGKVFAGERIKEEYEDLVLRYASLQQKSGVAMGNRSQFGTS